jgi:hypothetical protein
VGFTSPFVDNCGDACSVLLQVGVLQQYLPRTVVGVASSRSSCGCAFECFTWDLPLPLLATVRTRALSGCKSACINNICSSVVSVLSDGRAFVCFYVGFTSLFIGNCGDSCSVQLQVGVLQQYLQRTVPSVASGHKYRRAFECFTWDSPLPSLTTVGTRALFCCQSACSNNICSAPFRVW